jgi:hypothetical protein
MEGFNSRNDFAMYDAAIGVLRGCLVPAAA